LARVAAVAQETLERHADAFASQPVRLVALSSLAEGGDRLFAREALAQGWVLESVLPFAADEYENDFETAEARAEFRQLLGQAAAVLEIGDARSAHDSSEAYETAGLVMLDHADLMVAIWDGGESRGRGGTREILDEAARRGIPVVWISTTRADAVALWDGRRAEPLPELGAGASATPSRFDAAVAAVLSPPGGGGPMHDARTNAGPHSHAEDHAHGARSSEDDDAGDRLRRFLAERELPTPWWAKGYDVMLWLTAGRPLRLFAPGETLAGRASEWDAFIGELPPSGRLAPQLRDVLLTRFLWADHVASRVGRAYRGAYVLNFTLAALSVFVGLLILFVYDSILLKTICAILEFTLIATILMITRAGARGRWHDRFLDARRLAEMLRHARVLAPLGRATGIPAAELANAEAGERWTAWYALATLRELSLPHARADAAYLATVRAATMEHEVAPQLGYHRNNQRLLHHVHHALDHAGERIFNLTGILCLVWVFAAILYWIHIPGYEWIKAALKPLLTFLGAVLPAFGAALAGMRAQGDFQASARRSLATERELLQVSESFARPTADYREACLQQRWVADAMASELGSWHSLYANRPLTIPV
jgi:hypothetical protein